MWVMAMKQKIARRVLTVTDETDQVLTLLVQQLSSKERTRMSLSDIVNLLVEQARPRTAANYLVAAMNIPPIVTERPSVGAELRSIMQARATSGRH